jgi:hypothetical protein
MQALPEPIDLDDDQDIPLLAERLFHRYDFDALPFLIENCSIVIEFLPQLYPSMPSDRSIRLDKL